jgi:sugar phosphate isomerase/epimerase
VQLGIFAKTFEGADPHTVLTAARAAGYQTVHYNMQCSGLAALPDEVGSEVIAEIRGAVTATGVPLCGLSATFNMIHPDAVQRDKGLRQLQVLAGVAKALSVRVLTLCTGSRDGRDQWRHHPDNQSPSAWRDLCDGLARAIAIAETHDVLLGIEPETANVVNSAAAAKRLLTELQSERLRIVIDPANLFEHAASSDQHLIVSTAVQQLAPHIVMAHAKDRDASGRAVAMGQGVVDFDHYFGELRRAGFDGPVVTHGLRDVDAPGVCVALSDKIKTQGWKIAR